MTIALIPVKRLEQSKSRLLPELPDPDRQALTLAMLDDLVEALQRADAFDRIAVTTPDPLVAERARAARATVLLRPEPGLNAALDDAVARLAPGPDEALLVVLGDVAGALPADLAKLVGAAAGGEGAKAPRGVWIAPSADGGTSALLLRPAHAIPFRFGPESARRHREAAEAAGVAHHVLDLPSLAIDLDSPDDLAAFLATSGGGPRTRALLERVRSDRKRSPSSERRA